VTLSDALQVFRITVRAPEPATVRATRDAGSVVYAGLGLGPWFSSADADADARRRERRVSLGSSGSGGSGEVRTASEFVLGSSAINARRSGSAGGGSAVRYTSPPPNTTVQKSSSGDSTPHRAGMPAEGWASPPRSCANNGSAPRATRRWSVRGESDFDSVIAAGLGLGTPLREDDGHDDVFLADSVDACESRYGGFGGDGSSDTGERAHRASVGSNASGSRLGRGGDVALNRSVGGFGGGSSSSEKRSGGRAGSIAPLPPELWLAILSILRLHPLEMPLVPPDASQIAAGARAGLGSTSSDASLPPSDRSPGEDVCTLS
jgi:hypothetical protein